MAPPPVGVTPSGLLTCAVTSLTLTGMPASGNYTWNWTTGVGNIISGANCMTDPQSGWARQPDTTVNGRAAYHFHANFAAISANIAQ